MDGNFWAATGVQRERSRFVGAVELFVDPRQRQRRHRRDRPVAGEAQRRR